jgi:hypothetical protein
VLHSTGSRQDVMPDFCKLSTDNSGPIKAGTCSAEQVLTWGMFLLRGVGWLTGQFAEIYSRTVWTKIRCKIIWREALLFSACLYIWFYSQYKCHRNTIIFLEIKPAVDGVSETFTLTRPLLKPLMGCPPHLSRTVTLHPPLHFSVGHSNPRAVQFTQMVLRSWAASTTGGRAEAASSHSHHPRDFLLWHQCWQSDSVAVLQLPHH